MGGETKSKPAAKKAVTHPNTWVFYDGEFGRYHDIKLGLMTHALHYGTGCFEGIRAYWSEEAGKLFTFRQPEHFDRTRNSTQILHMSLPMSTQQMCEVTNELLRRNGYREDVYIRPLCYKS